MRATQCRSCGSENLTLVYDFGPQPLAGQFPLVPESQETAKKFPLDLTQCDDCALLQVTNLPPLEEIFHADYRYSSSTVPDLVRHFDEYAGVIEELLEPTAKVLEFGCNDGVLLDKLTRRGFACVGVDASDNVADLAREKGLDVRSGFFSPDLVEAEGLTGTFDLVTCSNVFAHIHDVGSAVIAAKQALRDGGLFAIEVQDGRILIEEAQFDTIYHEHLTYFTASTISRLLARYGFDIVRIDNIPMHGGGIRCISRLTTSDSLPAQPVQRDELVAEDRFSGTIERCAAQSEELRDSYGKVDGYGAAGRSQMFVNMVGGGDAFRQVFDDSSFRQGRYIVGTDVPINPYTGQSGSCCVILAWNYAPTIADKLRGKYEKIVTLLPEYREW